MILTANETQWVTERMKVYDIKYQEIYNELFDHIITAIEQKRINGDDKDIQTVFQQVVDAHFGGYRGIDEVVSVQEKNYTAHIRRSFRKIFVACFNWKLLVFTAIAMALTMRLPNVKLIHNILLVLIFLFAVSPMVYTYIVITRNIKIAAGRRSLLKGQLFTQAYLPLIALNGVLYLPSIFFLNDNTSTGVRLFGQLPLPVLMLVAIFYLLLNASVINLCNQVIKKQAVK